MPNGMIRRYDVTYYRSAIGLSDMQQDTVTSATTAELSGLDIFTSYTIFVEAFTVALGARSDNVTGMTSEDGKSIIHIDVRMITFFELTFSSFCSR